MTSPIQKLPPELLLLIFSINSEMVRREEAHSTNWKDTELYATHASSHTCRSWRSLILNTPDIWANSIDLDVLQHKKSYQVYLTKRVGTALISIRGQINSGPTQDFLLAFLLTESWSRVCSFDVKIRHHGQFHGAFWHFLQQRNSVLRTFIVNFEVGAFPKGFAAIDDREPLFAGDAPLLQAFQWIMPPSQPYKTRWFAQLTEFNCVLPSISSRGAEEEFGRRVASLWESLSQLKNLQYLKLVNCIRGHQDLPSKQVDLQTLRYLEIACNLPYCLSVLDHFNLNPGICLNLVMNSQPLFEARIEEVISRFRQMTDNYISLSPKPTHMTIHIYPALFFFFFKTTLPYKKQFKIRIQTTNDCALSSLTRVLSLNGLVELEALDLIVGQETQLNQQAKSQILNLLSQSSSITHFGPSPAALKFTTYASKNGRILPALKVLKVKGLAPGQSFGTQAIANCSTFLASRKDAGQPSIETLDLSLMGTKANMVDLSGLEGLKIVKNINGRLVEYIHGGDR